MLFRYSCLVEVISPCRVARLRCLGHTCQNSGGGSSHVQPTLAQTADRLDWTKGLRELTVVLEGANNVVNCHELRSRDVAGSARVTGWWQYVTSHADVKRPRSLYAATPNAASTRHRAVSPLVVYMRAWSSVTRALHLAMVSPFPCLAFASGIVRTEG